MLSSAVNEAHRRYALDAQLMSYVPNVESFASLFILVS